MFFFLVFLLCWKSLNSLTHSPEKSVFFFPVVGKNNSFFTHSHNYQKFQNLNFSRKKLKRYLCIALRLAPGEFQNHSQCEWVIKRAGTFKPNKTVMVGEDMGRYFAINHKGNEWEEFLRENLLLKYLSRYYENLYWSLF